MMLWWSVSKGHRFLFRLAIARMCFRAAFFNRRIIPNASDVNVVCAHVWRAFLSFRQFSKMKDKA